jgi:chorismate mutase
MSDKNKIIFENTTCDLHKIKAAGMLIGWELIPVLVKNELKTEESEYKRCLEIMSKAYFKGCKVTVEVNE